MRNPLFESLVTKANTYKNPFLNEQEKPQPGTVFSDYVKSLAKMGNDLAANFIIAVNSYPEPSKFKDEYVANLPTKIQAAIDAIDTKETIGLQLEKFYNALRQEVNNFLSASKGDTEYVKLLDKWRDNLSSGFKNYKVAIDKAMAYVKQQEESGQAKMEDSDWELLKKLVSGGLAELKDEMQTKATLAGESKTFFPEEFSSKDQVIEQLINNKIAIDFNSFSKILNEAKEDRVARRNARAESARVETLEGSVKGVLELIAMRSGDPSRKNFKSLAMNGEFVSLIKSVAEVRAELSVDDEQKKDIDFKQVSKTISNLESLFKSKKDAFDKAYDEESKTLRSFKTLSIATPEVEKYKQAGDNAFNTLSMLSQNAANQAAMEKKKPKPATDATGDTGATGATSATGSTAASSFKIEKPISKGSKEKDNVKKFQELVIDKMKDLKGKSPEYDALEKSKSQFGNFGSKTATMVKFLKDGFGLDSKNTDITQELIDKISSHDGKIKESFSLNEEFDLGAAKKGRSSSSSSKSGSSGSGGKSSGVEKKPGVFNCIKTADNTTKVSGGKATIERANKNKHTFNADGTYSYFWAEKGQTMDGTWKCTAQGFEATLKSDNDVFIGTPGVMNWKSNMDAAEKEKAAAAAKAAADLAVKAGEICKKILINMTGDTENEEKVAEIFRDEVTTFEMFKAVETFWNNNFWPSSPQLRNSPAYYKGKKVEEITKLMAVTPKKVGQSLRNLILNYFDNSQKALINGYLPAGVKKF